jgi:site-specific recombinase XerC
MVSLEENITTVNKDLTEFSPTMLPAAVKEPLAKHLDLIRRQHQCVQELLEHRDVSTTMITRHVSNRGGKGVFSPAGRL